LCVVLLAGPVRKRGTKEESGEIVEKGSRGGEGEIVGPLGRHPWGECETKRKRKKRASILLFRFSVQIQHYIEDRMKGEFRRRESNHVKESFRERQWEVGQGVGATAGPGCKKGEKREEDYRSNGKGGPLLM